MTHSMRLRAVAGALALVAGLGTLAACGSEGGATAGDKEGKVTVEKDGDKATAQTSQGPVTSGRDLPADFPKDKVPLLGEKVVNAVKGGDRGPFAWSVVMTSPRGVEDLSAAVEKDFTGAGYQADKATELGDVSIHQFSDATYDVGVTIARTGDGVTVTYLVKNK